jgi:hypothetical protein
MAKGVGGTMTVFRTIAADCRLSALALAAAFAVLTPGTASAQGFFEFFRSPPRGFSPPQVAMVNPGGLPSLATPARPAFSSGYTTYCVRLCDGRYFPMQTHSPSSAGQLCSAMCPATQTKIFSGGEISRAVAKDGARYSQLENAFLFRTSVVPSCTCNGRSSFGLASVDIKADPTLRPGDIVATGAQPPKM